MANNNYYRYGPKVTVDIPIAAAVVIDKGDLVMLTANLAVRMAATTDNLVFIGVADEAHTAADAAGTIRVIVPTPGTVFEFPCTSTTFAFGQGFQWAAAQNLALNETDQICVAVETKATASTTAKVTFQLPLLLVGDLS